MTPTTAQVLIVASAGTIVLTVAILKGLRPIIVSKWVKVWFDRKGK